MRQSSSVRPAGGISFPTLLIGLVRIIRQMIRGVKEYSGKISTEIHENPLPSDGGRHGMTQISTIERKLWTSRGLLRCRSRIGEPPDPCLAEGTVSIVGRKAACFETAISRQYRYDRAADPGNSHSRAIGAPCDSRRSDCLIPPLAVAVSGPYDCLWDKSLRRSSSLRVLTHFWAKNPLFPPGAAMRPSSPRRPHSPSGLHPCPARDGTG